MAIDLQVAKRLFFHMAVTDFFRAIRGGCYMGAFTLSVCAIDAMAYLRNALPKKGTGANFRHWVDRWIVPLNSECVPDVLWAVRCGLVHNYGYSDAMNACGVLGVRYAHNDPNHHWEQEALNIYTLSLDCHIGEVTIAAFRFFDKLASVCANDATLEKEVMRRAETLNLVRRIEIRSDEKGTREVRMRIEAPPQFRDMDGALACLDEDARPEMITITREIQEIYGSS